MKKLLFVCNRNVVLGPVAEAVFEHMGPSLLARWEVITLGCGQSIEINSSDVGKIQQILQKQAVPFKQKTRRVLTKKDVLRSDLVLCFETKSFDTVSGLFSDEKKTNLQMLSVYHPDGPAEIPDPISLSDPKSYEKCYWMVYKAVRELVKKLKEEAKPKRVRVNIPDPTIFTITSPSCWQKNRLQSPDIHLPDVIDPLTPSGSVFTVGFDIKLTPPENPTETEDNYNILSMIQKSLIEHLLDFEDTKLKFQISIEHTSTGRFLCNKNSVNFPIDSEKVCTETENLQNKSLSKEQNISSEPHVQPRAVTHLLSIFYLSPPQLELEVTPRYPTPPPVEVTPRWPTPPPVYKGGDLFDDIRKLKSSWRR